MKRSKPSPFHTFVAVLMAVLQAMNSSSLATGASAGTSSPPCAGSGNNDCPKPEGEEEEESSCPEEAGINSFRISGGNGYRQVTDLEVWGGVGRHQLAWVRHGHSRYNAGTSTGRPFGEGHGWRHAYQWQMAESGTTQLEIHYPTGAVWIFTKSPNGKWLRVASCPDALTQSGNQFTLQRANGEKYLFEKLTDAQGQTYYQLKNFQDTHGLTYPLTYDAQKRLVAVTEPAGRSLTINYQEITVDQARFQTLAAVPAVPPNNQWSEVPVSDPAAYRYLRYHSARQGYGNVAEIEFYTTDAQGQEVKLNGTPFGNGPSPAGQGDEMAFDGDTASFYHYPSLDFGFTGIDLGAGNEKKVTRVRYYPRSGYPARMYHSASPGRFEGSNVAPETIPVISSVQTSDGRAVTYTYTTAADPVLDYAWVVLAGAAYGDGRAASYGYTQNWAGVQPLLTAASDPRYPGPGARMRYEYRFSENITGNLQTERNYVDNSVLVTLDNNIKPQEPKITYPGGRVRKVLTPGSAAWQVTQITDGLGRVTKFAYGSGGQGYVSSRTDALNRVTSYTRTTSGQVLTRTRPDGTVLTWTRDSAGLPLTYKDGLGRTTTYTRDASRRITRIDYPDGSFETSTYNAFGQVLTHRSRNGGLETMTYDARGMKTSQTDALGQVTTLNYHPSDLLAAATDPEGHATSYEHDEGGLPTRVTYADANFVSYEYDAFRNRSKVTNELGAAWSATYDEFNRRTSATDPLLRTTSYEYSGISGAGCCGGGGSDSGDAHPSRIVLPSGKSVAFSYDLEWQKTSVTAGFGSPEAATTQYAYDAAGNLLATTDPLGKVWSHAYDSRNRRTSATNPLGHMTQWTYDAESNRLTEKRPDNGVTTMTYDAMDRLLTSTDPKQQTTQFAYDAAGNLTALTDARNSVTSFAYDLRNQRTRKTYADGSHEDWTYDRDGKVQTYTTAAGKVLTMTYDNRDRLTLQDWSDTTPDVSQSYDAAGRLTDLQSPISDLRYSYDAANQLLSETQDLQAPVNLPAKTVSYSYDPDGNRAGMTYPGGTAMQFTYTGRNQLKEVLADGPPPLASYTYDLAGNRTLKTLENGTSATYSYDDAHRLLGLDHRQAGVSFQRFDYTLNNVSNRTARAETNGGVTKSDTYGYDAIDQLAQVKYSHDAAAGTQARQADYTYDPAGNRQNVNEDADGSGPGVAAPTPYTANNLNQYTLIDSLAAPAYDANGNTTQLQTKLGDPAWTYQWDAQNRLISGSNGLTTFSFAYDARNRCVARTIGGVTKANYYDAWSLIEERTPADALQTYHLHGADLDEILCTIRDVSGTGVPTFHHHDGLGSVTALTSDLGILTERTTYDAYGLPSFLDPQGQPLAQSAQANRFLFTGREWFAELKLSDHRNRYYQPEVGRWPSRDPMEDAEMSPDGPNLYSYVHNEPVTKTDPFGLLSREECRKQAYDAYQACLGRARARFNELADRLCSGKQGVEYQRCIEERTNQRQKLWDNCHDNYNATISGCEKCPSNKSGFKFGPDGRLYENN